MEVPGAPSSIWPLCRPQGQEQMILKKNGRHGRPQRLIINLVPANGLHADVELGENDLMPSKAQFNNVHLRPLQRNALLLLRFRIAGTLDLNLLCL